MLWWKHTLSERWRAERRTTSDSLFTAKDGTGWRKADVAFKDPSRCSSLQGNEGSMRYPELHDSIILSSPCFDTDEPPSKLPSNLQPPNRTTPHYFQKQARSQPPLTSSKFQCIKERNLPRYINLLSFPLRPPSTALLLISPLNKSFFKGP